jgi:hypothetical protein
MKAQKLNKKFLRQRTFWDVDFDLIDVEKDKEFISRVVQKGSDDELFHLNSVFSFDYIFKVLSNYRGVPSKILNYYKYRSHAGS